MTGVPSVVFGLFIYVTLVVTQFGGSGFAAWKGSVALALLMLPVVARSAEVVLLLVPDSPARVRAGARRAALARDRAAIVLPTAAARPAHRLAARRRPRRRRDRAAAVHRTSTSRHERCNLGERMNSLPLEIFNDVQSPNPAVVDRAWGAALTLVALVLIMTLIARFIASRSRLS